MGDSLYTGTYGVFIKMTELVVNNLNIVDGHIPPEDLCDDPAVFGGRGVEDDPHVTVHMGLPDCRGLVEGVTAKTAPFNVRVRGRTLFETRDRVYLDGSKHSYDVVSIGVESPELFALHEKLAAVTGKKWHFPSYHAHVTLAYLKPGKGSSPELAAALEQGKEFRVDSVIYRMYNAKTYDTLPLRGAEAAEMEEIRIC